MRTALAFTLLLTTAPAFALNTGDRAPDFQLPAAQAGKVIQVNSQTLRQRGPLVVYFYPAAFTPGCSLEAKLFADHMDRFEAAGARVIGVSGDPIATLQRFSVSHCQGRFPVAADEQLRVARQYQAVSGSGSPYANRVSYVISTQGRVLHTVSGSDVRAHINESLAAVQRVATPR